MVAVIALLAVLLVFGISLAVISSSQHVGAGLDVQGIRAYHAARGGIEWGLYQVIRNGQPCAAINQTIAYPAGNLAGFNVTVACASSTHDEGGTSVTMYRLTATGCNQASCAAVASPPPPGYVERQLRVTVGSN